MEKLPFMPGMTNPPEQFPWETGPWCVRCSREMEHTSRHACTDTFTCPGCGYQVEIVWD